MEIPTSSARRSWIDLLKGVLILLVVFGHVVSNGVSSGIIRSPGLKAIHDGIYLFHMPAFFFLSGYLMKDLFRSGGGKNGRAQKIVLKFSGLLIPYLLFSALYWAAKYFFAGTAAVNNAVGGKDLFLVFIRPIGEYWFLYTMIFLYAVFYLLTFFLKKAKTPVLLLASGAVAVGFYLLYLFIESKLYFTGFQRSLPYFLYFFAGFIFARFDREFPRRETLPLGIILSLSGICGFFAARFLLDEIPFYTSLVTSFCMIFGLIYLAKGASCRFFETLGQTTLPIYLIHPFLIVIFKVILVRFVANDWIYTALSFLLTALLSFAAYRFVIRKVKFFDFFFYPAKYVKFSTQK